MTAIQNWRNAWRMASVQIASLAVVFGLLPADQQSSLLAMIGVGPERIPAIIGVAFIVARLVSQPAIAQPAPEQQGASGG